MQSFFGKKGPSQPKRKEIETEVSSVTIVRHPVTGEMFSAVFLKEKHGEREFSMFIGLVEAHAIECHRQKITPLRPLTHDLYTLNLAAWDIEVQKVVIMKLVKDEEGGTFYAEIVEERQGEVRMLDARPSDAIALALRFGAPIYAVDELLNECHKPENKSQQEIDEILARMKPFIDDAPGQ